MGVGGKCIKEWRVCDMSLDARFENYCEVLREVERFRHEFRHLVISFRAEDYAREGYITEPAADAK